MKSRELLNQSMHAAAVPVRKQKAALLSEYVPFTSKKKNLRIGYDN